MLFISVKPFEEQFTETLFQKTLYIGCQIKKKTSEKERKNQQLECTLVFLLLQTFLLEFYHEISMKINGLFVDKVLHTNSGLKLRLLNKRKEWQPRSTPFVELTR